MDQEANECTILVPKPAKTLQQNGGNPHKSITFSFDRVYAAHTTTAEIYNEIPYSLITVRTPYEKEGFFLGKNILKRKPFSCLVPR